MNSLNEVLSALGKVQDQAEVEQFMKDAFDQEGIEPCNECDMSMVRAMIALNFTGDTRARLFDLFGKPDFLEMTAGISADLGLGLLTPDQVLADI